MPETAETRAAGGEGFALTVPLVQASGGAKMGKTAGNAIWLGSVPIQAPGHALDVPDQVSVEWLPAWPHRFPVLQQVAFAHQAFEAGNAGAMFSVKQRDHAVEIAAALGPRPGEEPVHGRREPDRAQ